MKSKLLFLWISLAIYWVVTAALLITALEETDGHFCYPMDDTYIHMAIAKHFIQNESWAVSQTGFSSTTSSPLWTLIIAGGFSIFGVNDWIPLILSFLCGNMMIVLSFLLLIRNSTPFRLLIFLTFIVLFIPLPIMALTGMEHALQGGLTLWLLFHAATLLTTKENKPLHLALLLFLSSLVTITRYEGLFLIVAVSFSFVISRRFRTAFLTVVAGLLPITIYGLLSVSQGWFFFPNPILIKGNFPAFSLEGILGYLWQLPVKLVGAPHVLLLIIACLMMYFFGKHRMIIGQREKYLVGLVILTSLMHMQFASTGWFFRYEGYLILMMCVLCVDLFDLIFPVKEIHVGKRLIFDTMAGVILGILLFLPLITRASGAFWGYPIAVRNTYEQQYQMGLFLRDYYEEKTVVANDIGAISYLSDSNILDLYGLGNMEVARLKRKGEFTQSSVAELVKRNRVDLVMIYNSWFEGKIPSEWEEVGKWQLTDNIVATDTVSFYAPTPELVTEVSANLRAFSGSLPASVIQSGRYLER